MKYVSLFAGIGGFDLALNRLGHTCVYANEWDKYAAQIYEKNFQRKSDTRDIRTVDASEIPGHDLLCGGFPCQSFSIAGKRGGFQDTRGTLFFEIARIANAKRPAYLFLENVKGLLNHDNGKTFETIMRAIDELGYDAQWQVCNSKNFGVPQNRERVFIIANLRGKSRPKVFPLKTINGKAIVGTIKNSQGQTRSTSSSYVAEVHNIITPTIRATEYKHGDNQTVIVEDFYPDRVRTFIEAPTLRGERNGLKVGTLRTHKDGNGFREVKSGLAPTIPARAREDGSGQPVIEQAMRIRRLTPTECERLQGFPDGWTEGVSDTQRYKCLGNAVTVNVVYEIARRAF